MAKAVPFQSIDLFRISLNIRTPLTLLRGLRQYITDRGL
jgi:hypothetical protein